MSGKGNQGAEESREIVVSGTGISALLSEASIIAIRGLRLLGEQMENQRVKDDPEVAMRVVRLATEATTGIFTTSSQIVSAMKDKSGKIPGLFDGNIQATDAALTATTSGKPAGGKLGRLGALTGEAGK